MSTENVAKNYLPVIERALSSFLKAIAEVIPNVDLKKASDSWIHAMETTRKNESQKLDQFLRQVTINALTIDPKLLLKD